MKILTGEALFPFIHGVLSCSVSNQGLVEFHRFTDRQIEVYRKAGEREKLNYEERALASSGVVLEMNSDSSFIAMEFKMQLAARPFAGFDLYVDDVLTDHWFTGDLRSDDVLSFELPEGMHHIQIFFPWAVIVRLKDVILEERSLAQPVSGKIRAIAYGDSITQGYISKHPSVSYVNHMVRELNLDCVNQAIGGYYFDADSLDPELAAFGPELITAAYGTNDYTLMVTPEQISKNCADYTERLCSIFPDAKILGLLPIYRGDDRSQARNRFRDFKIADWMDVIRRTYLSHPGITVLEDSYFPKHEDFFAPDLVHPNDLGFMFYGQAVTKAVKELLD